MFFTPGEEERVWAEEVTDSAEHQLALLVALRSYQRMGCFPKVYDVPDPVVEFARRTVGLPESAQPVYASGRTAERYPSWVRERCGVRYDGPAARSLAEGKGVALTAGPAAKARMRARDDLATMFCTAAP